MKDLEAFALTLLHSATCAHIQHWQTDSYAKHKALQKYYEAIPGLVDDLVESCMGKYGKVGKFDAEFEIIKDPVKYFESLIEFVEESRKHLSQDSEIQNLVDAIADLINTTTYKLKELS